MLTESLLLYLLVTLMNVILLVTLVRLSRQTLMTVLLYPIFFHFGITYIGVGKIMFTQNNTTTVGIDFDQNLVNTLSIEFALSWTILLCFILLIFWLERGKFKLQSHLDYFSTVAAKVNNRRLLFITLFLLLFDTVYYGTPPGLMLITHGVSEALSVKGQILTSKMENGLPFVGYLVRYIPMVAFVHAILFMIFSPQRSYVFIFILIIFCLYSALSLVKSYLILPVGCLIFSFIFMNKVNHARNQKLLFPFLIVFCILPFFLLNGSDALSSLIVRILFTQHEGMFLIRDLYEQPAEQFLFYSSPIRHLMSGITIDPAAAVVEHFFGRHTGWVNMNSFYSGQGYTMFGYWYIIIIPLIYCVTLVLSFEMAKILLSRSMSIIVVASVNIFVPFSNNIANLVWGKEVIAVLITSVVLRFMLRHVPNFQYLKI